MINTWQPNVTNSDAIDANLLNLFAQLGSQALQEKVQLNALVSKTQQSQAQSWIRLPEEAWQQVIEKLPQEQLYPLATFFTLAEMQLAGWECGSKNPAIWIFRWLRNHQQQPSKEQVKALKNLTDNRFIPYGSVF